MKSAQSFKEFFEASFLDENDPQTAYNLSMEFFADFILSTPLKLDLLESYLLGGNIRMFYKSLSEQKYLIEFSDDLNRYWHLLRGYSEALSKLKEDQSVKSSKRLYFYYFDKYGDRRLLRKEYWLEGKRWEFLDELLNIYTEDELRGFILKYHQVLLNNLKIYQSLLMLFINDLQHILTDSYGQLVQS